MQEFEGKVILITGGGSGIGKATARKFAEDKAVVFICGRNMDKLEKVKKEFLLENLELNVIKVDVSKVSDCEIGIKKVIEEAGKLDVLVNAAGIYIGGNSEDMTEEMWDQVIDTNLKGTFFMSRYAIPELEKTKGSIINVSSDAGLVGNNGVAIYCASKGGVTLLTKSMGLELASKGIRVNAVCPGDVDTPMVDFEAEKYCAGDKEKYVNSLLKFYPPGTDRIATPKEVAECIYFLASSKVAAINGACLSIDFGVTSGY